jgi:hypothetical protein
MKAMIGMLLVSAMGCATDEAAPAAVGDHGATAPAGPAYLEIQFTDTSDARPVANDAQLWVTIGRLEVEHADGHWTTISAQPMRFDLFAAEAGDAAVVASSMLPAGGYRTIAIEVDTAQLVAGGVQTSFTIQDGAMKLPLSMQVADTKPYALLFDFNAAESFPAPTQPSTTTAPPSNLPPVVMAPAISLAAFLEM